MTEKMGVPNWEPIFMADRGLWGFPKCKLCDAVSGLQFRGVEDDDPRQKQGYDLAEMRCTACGYTWAHYSMWD